MPAVRSALGQVLLAQLPNDVVSEALARKLAAGMPPAIDRAELDVALSVARLSGVAITRGEAATLDVAVPVVEPTGRVAIGLEISVPGFADANGRVLDSLRAIADRLSQSRAEPGG